MPTISFREKCKNCDGTGLYVGFAERNGAAVVCNTCEGTGCHEFEYEYEEFVERADREGIRRVYRVNPGICIGEGDGVVLDDFGGLSHEDWKNGKPFSPGTEDRKHTCPTWWYQTADYEKRPQWLECYDSLGTTFSRCPHFGGKEDCWKRWDKEYA